MTTGPLTFNSGARQEPTRCFQPHGKWFLRRIPLGEIMKVNPDFSDLLKTFNANGVKYLVVGAYAVMVYAEPRFTKDLDIWVEPTQDNAERVWKALEEFGAPLQQVTLADFRNKELVYQIGIEPNRIDILMGISGIRFETAWKNRNKRKYGDENMQIIGKNDLMRSKRKAGRDQDLLDLKRLKEAE